MVSKMELGYRVNEKLKQNVINKSESISKAVKSLHLSRIGLEIDLAKQIEYVRKLINHPSEICHDSLHNLNRLVEVNKANKQHFFLIKSLVHGTITITAKRVVIIEELCLESMVTSSNEHQITASKTFSV